MTVKINFVTNILIGKTPFSSTVFSAFCIKHFGYEDPILQNILVIKTPFVTNFSTVKIASSKKDLIATAKTHFVALFEIHVYTQDLRDFNPSTFLSSPFFRQNDVVFRNSVSYETVRLRKSTFLIKLTMKA